MQRFKARLRTENNSGRSSRRRNRKANNGSPASDGAESGGGLSLGIGIGQFPNIWYQQKLIPVFVSVIRKLKTSRVNFQSIADPEVVPSSEECLDAIWKLVDAMDANGEVSIAELDVVFQHFDRYTWWEAIRYFFKHARNVLIPMPVLSMLVDASSFLLSEEDNEDHLATILKQILEHLPQARWSFLGELCTWINPVGRGDYERVSAKLAPLLFLPRVEDAISERMHEEIERLLAKAAMVNKLVCLVLSKCHLLFVHSSHPILFNFRSRSWGRENIDTSKRLSVKMTANVRKSLNLGKDAIASASRASALRKSRTFFTSEDTSGSVGSDVRKDSSLQGSPLVTTGAKKGTAMRAFQGSPLVSGADVPAAAARSPPIMLSGANLMKENENQDDVLATTANPCFRAGSSNTDEEGAESGSSRLFALYSFDPRTEDEIVLKTGDGVTVLDKDGPDQDWWHGRNERTGEEGLFPRVYIGENEEASNPKLGVL